jgi:hypothetical protein
MVAGEVPFRPPMGEPGWSPKKLMLKVSNRIAETYYFSALQDIYLLGVLLCEAK